MSHTAVRRVAIRLLHDPTFVDALHADPTAALAGLTLSTEERRWLIAVPRAAWRTDPARPERVRAALQDEFPASVALAPSRSRAFVQSSQFHAAVQERGSLALAFGAHMMADPDRRVLAVAQLETAIAAVRRAPSRVIASGGGTLRLTPNARVVMVAARGPDLLSAIRTGATPSSLGTGEEPVLVLRDPVVDQVTIEALLPDLAAVLERATEPVSRAELEALVRSRGTSPNDTVEILDGLIGDGILL